MVEAGETGAGERANDDAVNVEPSSDAAERHVDPAEGAEDAEAASDTASPVDEQQQPPEPEYYVPDGPVPSTYALDSNISETGDDADRELATAVERYKRDHDVTDEEDSERATPVDQSSASPVFDDSTPQEPQEAPPVIRSLSDSLPAPALETPTGIEESLCRMFESEHFNVRMCVMYIAHYQNEAPVLLYLIHKLQTYPLAHVEQFIPQLVCLLLHSPANVGSVLEKHLFLTACARCMHFALKTIWHIESDTTAHHRNRRIQLREKVEAAAINRKNRAALTLQSGTSGVGMDVGGVEAEVIAKDRLCEYYNSEMIFISHLTGLSNELRRLPREEREGRLSNELAQISAQLEHMHVNLPLSNADGAFRRIVRVPAIPGRSRVLNSRERAPYLVLFEYIEGGAPHQPEEVGSPHSPSTSPIPNTATASMSLDVSIYEGYFTNSYRTMMYNGRNPANASNGRASPSLTEEEALVSARLDKIFGNSWSHTVEIARSLSPYGKKEGWGLIPVIVKAGDDMRQEVLAMQLISTFDRIWKEADLPVRLNPYGVVVTSCDSGIIELVTDAASIDGIKKKMEEDQRTLVDYWAYAYGEPDSAAYRTAQRNFVESMAGYSAVSYILQLKDRHNANILLRRDGSVVHIDFGFMLANSPGGLNIESMPFKLPQEAIDVMGGVNSDLFQYFRVLVYSAFREAAKHADQIIFLVEMMITGPHFPCFGTDPRATLEALKSRFHTSGDLSIWVKEAIDQSCDNWGSASAVDMLRSATNQAVRCVGGVQRRQYTRFESLLLKYHKYQDALEKRRVQMNQVTDEMKDLLTIEDDLGVRSHAVEWNASAKGQHPDAFIVSRTRVLAGRAKRITRGWNDLETTMTMHRMRIDDALKQGNISSVISPSSPFLAHAATLRLRWGTRDMAIAKQKYLDAQMGDRALIRKLTAKAKVAVTMRRFVIERQTLQMTPAEGEALKQIAETTETHLAYLAERAVRHDVGQGNSERDNK